MTVFVFLENENAEKLYSFFIFKSNFKDTENKNWIQILNPNYFLVVGPTENENKKKSTFFFS